MEIDLHFTKDVPAGKYQTTLRTRRDDRDTIQAAAALVGMPGATFIRTVALQVARQLLTVVAKSP